MNVFTYSLIGMSLFLLMGCSTSESKWEDVKRKNTIETYTEFQNLHPEYAGEIKKRIAALEEMEWGNALRTDNLSDYYRFLQMYPNTSHWNEINTRSMALLDKELSNAAKENVEVIKVAADTTLSFEDYTEDCKANIVEVFTKFPGTFFGSNSLLVSPRKDSNKNCVCKITFFENPTNGLKISTDIGHKIIHYHSGTGLIIISVRSKEFAKIQGWAFNIQ